MAETREKLIGLLNYVEQVVRLDERVAFRVAEYRLPDGSTFAIGNSDTRNLPSVHHDLRDEEGPIWLEIERLTRREPPVPSPDLAHWIVLSADPMQHPEVRNERILTVSSVERDVALANGDVRPDDVLEAPHESGDAESTPPRFDLILRLEDRPELGASIANWVADIWTPWSLIEQPRRRTIALYQVLYKIFQFMEVGVAESPIELMWGVGVVHWQKEGRVVERPLVERRVEIELDDARGGLIRIRPTTADALFDLKPYEDLGSGNLPALSDLIRNEIQRVADEGISPFLRESFEPILSAAAARLDPEGVYAPEMLAAASALPNRLTVTDRWMLFARPRSQHVVLRDIDRLRRSAENEKRSIEGLAARLVTHPSADPRNDGWEPLDSRIGGTSYGGEPPLENVDVADVFFPKPYNDDQREIVTRLSSSDGLVVQGPPGTGKTHTIANLLCHAMAMGQRVLVVSRGEAALSALKDQLPKEVQPLAISVLSNEREGLRQIESAIREIQSVVEGTPPETRKLTIVRLEEELAGLQKRIQAIDNELDKIASDHLSKIGPRGETPAELAQRIVKERDAHAWFTDRPVVFSCDTSLRDSDVTQLHHARMRCGDQLNHLRAQVPSPADLPTSEIVARCHDDLIAAAQFESDARKGPVRGLKIAPENASKADDLAQSLDRLANVRQESSSAPWIEQFRCAAIQGAANPWSQRLRERLSEWSSASDEHVKLLRRSVEIPHGLIDNQDVRDAVLRGVIGQRLWPLIHLGKGSAKALLNQIRLDGSPIGESDQDGWRHVSSVLTNLGRQREAKARWDNFAREIGAPEGELASAAVDFATEVLRVCDEFRRQMGELRSILPSGYSLEPLANDPDACRALANQFRASASATRLSSAQEHCQRWLLAFDSADPTSELARNLIHNAIGNPGFTSEQIAAEWNVVLRRLERLKSLSGDFALIRATTDAIASAGAPAWADKLCNTSAGIDEPIATAAWRDAWDNAAADVALERIDSRQRLVDLSKERDVAERQCRRLSSQIVRERTFYALNLRLSPAIKSALVEFVRALARIGKGTGRSAWAHRGTAREAMARCYGAVPCWIMPTWRVAEQLPAELGMLDLVIIDEASQSDVTELPVLLRGKKILVVGDDRQVSPTAPFVTQAKIRQLRHHYLDDMPYKSLLEPGESIYDLMRAVFPNQRLMLKEHFRCVEPIIQFSMQFYPEKMLPLRIPSAFERLDPPLIDIYVRHGSRGPNKINRAEADVIVGDIVALTARPDMRRRSIGVISLVGKSQAEHIRGRLSETIGEEVMQRHRILCGDSATFQGSERDIVYLSMVADSANKTALTMLRYEQRFNVAVSRARDRVVLVRSVRRDELNPNDLKARLIAHFENPMPEREVVSDALSDCESFFERDFMQRLLDQGYRVQGQVGSLGYRIDMVVEGLDGTRLAVECDGDRFHGPEQWQQDMRRQRALERVGWRFWRCFASSFYRAPESVMDDLVQMLTRMGIEPLRESGDGRAIHRFTEHLTIDPESHSTNPLAIVPVHNDETKQDAKDVDEMPLRPGIQLGDKVVLVFSDDQKRVSARVVDGANDLEKGQLSVSSPLGRAIMGAEEGDEVELSLENGRTRKVLIEGLDRTENKTFNRIRPATPPMADAPLPK